ncbi:unnamed protein product [Mortierella alpina]
MAGVTRESERDGHSSRSLSPLPSFSSFSSFSCSSSCLPSRIPIQPPAFFFSLLYFSSVGPLFAPPRPLCFDLVLFYSFVRFVLFVLLVLFAYPRSTNAHPPSNPEQPGCLSSWIPHCALFVSQPTHSLSLLALSLLQPTAITPPQSSPTRQGQSLQPRHNCKRDRSHSTNHTVLDSHTVSTSRRHSQGKDRKKIRLLAYLAN